MMKQLLKLRGDLPSRTRTLLDILGIAFLLLIWYLLTISSSPIIPVGILPSPSKVIYAFIELFEKNNLLNAIFKSVGLNVTGYLEAIFISLVLGFLIGLLPLFRGLFSRPIDALRFVPLTGVMGLFITWFGLGIDMKVHFLAFGILIYMLPVIINKIDDVEAIYLKTVYTLGASPWQTIKSVYLPYVLSKFSDDIRVLTAISWTYIIIIESQGNEGGMGALMWRAGIRQGNVEKLFAMLCIIILIGFFQDKLLVWLDKKFFKFKYQEEAHRNSSSITSQSLFQIWERNIKSIIKIVFSCALILTVLNEPFGFLFEKGFLSLLFGDTWVIMIFLISVFACYLFWDFIKGSGSRIDKGIQKK